MGNQDNWHYQDGYRAGVAAASAKSVSPQTAAEFEAWIAAYCDGDWNEPGTVEYELAKSAWLAAKASPKTED